MFVSLNRQNTCLRYQASMLIKVPLFLIKHGIAKTYRGLEI